MTVVRVVRVVEDTGEQQRNVPLLVRWFSKGCRTFSRLVTAHLSGKGWIAMTDMTVARSLKLLSPDSLKKSGLPQELYAIWEAYPWRFGEAFCIFKSLIAEMTSCASVLTITAFSIERYIAICHPLRSHKMVSLSRTVKIIIIIWLMSFLCALPFPIHTRTFYALPNNITGGFVRDSLLCGFPPRWKQNMIYMFQVSTFLFFVTPVVIITVLYILIGFSLRGTFFMKGSTRETKPRSPTQIAKTPPGRKVVLRMLVAVVVAFVICWAPYHAQRLMVLYITSWTHDLLDIQSRLFYISGVLYFVSSTVNPILYNLMSRRYRQAFRDTLCCCYRSRADFRRNSGYQHSEKTALTSFKPMGSPFISRTFHSEKISPKHNAASLKTNSLPNGSYPNDSNTGSVNKDVKEMTSLIDFHSECANSSPENRMVSSVYLSQSNSCHLGIGQDSSSHATRV